MLLLLENAFSNIKKIPNKNSACICQYSMCVCQVSREIDIFVACVKKIKTKFLIKNPNFSAMHTKCWFLPNQLC
jgi:hypothetical protein